jgi:hypothetical protein
LTVPDTGPKAVEDDVGAVYVAFVVVLVKLLTLTDSNPEVAVAAVPL